MMKTNTTLYRLKKELVKHCKYYNPETSKNGNEVTFFLVKLETINSSHKHGAINSSTFVYIYKLNKQIFWSRFTISENDITKQIFEY